MAIVRLFVYQWPSQIGCTTEVGLDSETGQAYDLMYVLDHAYGGGHVGYFEKLERKAPITYDDVRRLAQVAYDTALARKHTFIIDPHAYDALSEDTWRDFVQHPPEETVNPSAVVRSDF